MYPVYAYIDEMSALAYSRIYSIYYTYQPRPLTSIPYIYYTQIKLSEILKLDNRTARILVSEAAEILSLWSETYFSTRKRIEETSDHRWEFDRKILFGRTDYMSNICHHIIEILDGLEGFKFFLGPQLRSLTGEGAIGMREVYVFVGVWHL